MYEISVVSYQGAAPADRICAVFGKDGGTIGRGSGNSLVLPDPNRFVSRVQAKVELIDGRLVIANASSANPLLVNDRELDAGAGASLADGDELRIGLYLLRVRRLGPEDDAAEKTQLSVALSPPANLTRDTGPPLARASPPAAPPVQPSPDPLDPLQLSTGASGNDPFADLIPPEPVVPRRDAAAAAASQSSRQGGAPVVPDDVWDDLARLAPKASASPVPDKLPLPGDFDAFAEQSAAKRNADDPLAEFAQNSVALDSFDKLDAPIDAIFNEAPAKTELDVIPDPDPVGSDPLATPASVDPLAIFAEGAQPPTREFARSEPDQVPELEAWFRPAEPRFAPGPAAQPAKVPAATPPVELMPASPLEPTAGPPVEPSGEPHASALGVASRAARGDRQPPRTPVSRRGPAIDIDGPIATAEHAPNEASLAADRAPSERQQALLDAFLAGAGIPNAIVKDGLTPETMTAIGALLSAAVQGTIELIAARAMLKREVKADVTLIATTKNNPLKFLPDAESALLQMFGARIPGFMAPVEAMQDAFHDLRAHEVGVIAGMRAALAHVLRRFEPGELEKRLKRPGVLEGLLPNSREARLWQTFTEMYGDISREAQDDFQALFGKAFLAAYENEVARLKGS